MDSISNSYLTVDLNRIKQNAAAIHQDFPQQQLIPVLKADAYGLGMKAVANALSALPSVSCFAVAQAKEGILLKQEGIRKDILVLNEVLPCQIDAAVQYDLTLTVGNIPHLLLIAGAAHRLNRKARVQIKFDTGLHRIGFEQDSMASLLHVLLTTSGDILLTGAYSHFADPDDAVRCRTQYQLFCSLSDQLIRSGFSLPMRHICDSAASERYPQYALDAIRIGRRLAFDAPDNAIGSVQEAASLYSFITDIHVREKGSRLGYGSGPVLNDSRTIAAVGIGYGDGLDPHMAEYGLSVLVNGTVCPVLYCFMDQILIDVTDCPAKTGDRVTLFGYDDAGNFLSAQSQARKLHALEGCALTAALLPRVERIYV